MFQFNGYLLATLKAGRGYGSIYSERRRYAHGILGTPRIVAAAQHTKLMARGNERQAPATDDQSSLIAGQEAQVNKMVSRIGHDNRGQTRALREELERRWRTRENSIECCQQYDPLIGTYGLNHLLELYWVRVGHFSPLKQMCN